MQNATNPDWKLNVLMSVYKPDMKRFEETMISLCNQTYTNFKLIVCIDGDDKQVEKVISKYEKKLSIDVVINKSNIGLTKSLNKILSIANSDLIARIDAEDIYVPEKLQLQVNQFKENKKLVLCGCNFIEQETSIKSDLPLDDASIRVELVKHNAFAHSCVMFKRPANFFYNDSYRYSQDYECWLRLAYVGEMLNIDKCLVYRRGLGLSYLHEREQLYYKLLAKLSRFSEKRSLIFVIYFFRDVLKLVLGPSILRFIRSIKKIKQ